DRYRIATGHAFSRLFFFSSRRRHTRSKRDWSSDVCSSDLIAACELSATGCRARAKGIRIGSRLVKGNIPLVAANERTEAAAKHRLARAEDIQGEPDARLKDRLW